MKYLTIILLFLALMLSNCNSKNDIHSQACFTVPVVVDNTPDINDNKQLSKEAQTKASFEELLDQVPITPLPFGVTNLKDITVYDSLESKLVLDITYDKEDKFGLKEYFANREELDPFIEHEGHILHYAKDNYFAKRFPDLKNGNKMILLYSIDSATLRINAYDPDANMYYMKSIPDRYTYTEHWTLAVCEPSGKVVNGNTYFAAATHIKTLSYLDENKVIWKRQYKAPESEGRISGTPLGDDVSEVIADNKSTILFYEELSKIKEYKEKEADGQFARYVWINNKPSLLEIVGEELEGYENFFERLNKEEQ